MLSRIRIVSQLSRCQCLSAISHGTIPVSTLVPPKVSLQVPDRRTHTKDAPHSFEEPNILENSIRMFSTSQAVKLDQDEQQSSALVERINSQLEAQSFGRLFAVVFFAGKQRKVTAEDIIVLDKHIEADVGERIRINKVLLVGSKDFTLLGRPVLSPSLVCVEATVLEKTLSHTRVFFRYLRRQNNRKMRVKKDPYTYLRINSIELAPSLDAQKQDLSR